MDYPIRFEGARHAISASGAFSRAMAACFPLLEESTSPRLLLGDRPYPSARGKKIITSDIVESDCPLILDPATTSASLVAVDFRPDADFALGTASLSSPDLVIGYDSAILGSFPPSYATSVPLDLL